MDTYKIKGQGKRYNVTVSDKATGGATVKIEDREFEVEFVGENSTSPPSATMARPPVATSALTGDGSIVAPISGKIIVIHVNVGDPISADQVLLKLEAMKMENDIASPISGTVQEISVSEGSEAVTGQLLMVVG